MRALLILSALVLTLAGCQSGRNAHPLPDACHQAPDSGQCRAAIPGYYYDSDSESCQEFTWGGCEGQVVDPRFEAEPGRDGGVVALHPVVVQLPEGDHACFPGSLVAVSGRVEEVLGPAVGLVGRCRDRLDELEAENVGVEAMGGLHVA